MMYMHVMAPNGLMHSSLNYRDGMPKQGGDDNLHSCKKSKRNKSQKTFLKENKGWSPQKQTKLGRNDTALLSHYSYILCQSPPCPTIASRLIIPTQTPFFLSTRSSELPFFWKTAALVIVVNLAPSPLLRQSSVQIGREDTYFRSWRYSCYVTEFYFGVQLP